MRGYFDIDGVFNAVKEPQFAQIPQREATGWLGEWQNSYIPVHHFESLPEDWGDKFHLCWSNELIDSINALSQAGNVEIVWATTWRNLAPKIFSPTTGIKGEDWRVLHAPWERIEQHSPWWKHELVMADIKANPVEKFVWVDDDLAINPEAVEWAESIPGAKVIIPSAFTGLTRQQWEEIVDHLSV
jgi:hypothetical protein